MNFLGAVMNIAEGVTAALKIPIGGRLLAGIIASLGAVQIGLIAAQKPPAMPSFIEGGVVGGGPGVDTTLARVTRGEFIMPPQQTAENIGALEAMRDGSGGGQEINITPAAVSIDIDGRELATAIIPFITEESDRGRLRINPRSIEGE